MVEEASHAHTLLLAAGEHVLPVGRGVPAALATHDVMEVDHFEDAVQVGVRFVLLTHVLDGVRVYHLIAQASDRHVRPATSSCQRHCFYSAIF